MPISFGPALEPLKARIRSAFANTPYPGDDALVSGDVSYDPEYREVAAAFRGKRWQHLSRTFIREHQDSLPLLTPAALRYFLPAYLLACLEDEEGLDAAPQNVVSRLQVHDLGAIFSAIESNAIGAYLDHWRSRSR